MNPQPGDFATVATGGWAALLIRAVTRSPVNHAIGYCGMTMGFGVPMIVEAQPSGARIVPLSNYDGCDLHWSTNAPGVPVMNAGQRGTVVANYRNLVGTPYSWVDDVCIGLAHLVGVHIPAWVRRRLNRVDRQECAQLVDVAYQRAGLHLFRDGRYPGDVAPSDLYDLTNPQGDTTP